MRFFFILVVFVFNCFTIFSQDADIQSDIDYLVSVLEKRDCNWRQDSVSLAFSRIITEDAGEYTPSERYLYSHSLVHIARLLFNWDSPEAALLILNKASLFDPSNAEAVILKSRFYVASKDFDQAYNCLVKVYSRISSSQYSQAVSLTRYICDDYDYKIQRLYSQGQIKEAFYYATRLDTLLMLYPQGVGEYNSLMDSILVRLQDHYIEHIKFLYKNGEYDSALVYIRGLNDLMANYIWYMDSLTIVAQKDKIKELMQDFVNLGLGSGQIDVVISAINSFESLCDISPDNECTLMLDTLRKKIYQVNFDILISHLRQYIENKDFNRGIAYISKIEKFISEYDIRNTSEFFLLRDTLLDMALKEKTYKIKQLVDRHEYDSARLQLNQLLTDEHFRGRLPDSLHRYYRTIEHSYILYLLENLENNKEDIVRAEKLILKYGFDNDSLIMSALFASVSKLGNNCLEKHEIFFQRLAELRIIMMNGDYTKASDILSDLIKQNDTLCPYVVDTLTELRNRISPLVTYQLLYDDVLEANRKHQYKSCLDGIFAINRFYNTRKLYQYDVEKPDLYKMITSFNNTCVFIAVGKGY